VIVRRLKCPRCGAFRREGMPFLSHPRARQTRALERFVVELRRHMSISAIASAYGLNWKTVKAIELRHLTRKYRRIRLKDVRHLGLDEIHVGRGRFLTIAMNLDTEPEDVPGGTFLADDDLPEALWSGGAEDLGVNACTLHEPSPTPLPRLRETRIAAGTVSCTDGDTAWRYDLGYRPRLGCVPMISSNRSCEMNCGV
jgi:hypothetical protein